MTRYVFTAGAVAISLFSAGVYLVSLGLEDAAFRGSDRTHPGWAPHDRGRASSVI